MSEGHSSIFLPIAERVQCASTLARAYFRLLSKTTNPPTTRDLRQGEKSSESASERLDFPSGIAMRYAGQDDDNHLAREEL